MVTNVLVAKGTSGVAYAWHAVLENLPDDRSQLSEGRAHDSRKEYLTGAIGGRARGVCAGYEKAAKA
jgi:hypothetical protein